MTLSFFDAALRAVSISLFVDVALRAASTLENHVFVVFI